MKRYWAMLRNVTRNKEMLWGVFVLVLLGVGLLFIATRSNEITITKTARGFVPSRIIINAGDIVVFKTEESRDFWPASDFHPTHGQYAEFDPKHPILSSDEWRFTFTTPGVWGFHDHLDSQFVGQIIVRGSPGQITAECLKQRENHSLTPICWEADITEVLTRDGLSAAFARVDTLYKEDPAFARNCHDVMHILGSTAFREFKNSLAVTLDEQTAYCGYGFYHGFIETMLLENGATDFRAVRDYCELVRDKISPNAAGSCFHGIGHAIFDSLPGTLWGNPDDMTKSALTSCEKAVTTDADRTQCASGVFNSLANALSAQTYSLSFTGLDTVAFCDAQDSLYQRSCYGEIGIGHIRNAHMDRKTALAFIYTLKDPIRSSQLFFYFSDETKRMMSAFNAQALGEACTMQDTQDSHMCIDGVLQGIREETPVDTGFLFSFPVCESFTDAELKRYCISKTVSISFVSVEAQDEFQNACRAIVESGDEALCTP